MALEEILRTCVSVEGEQHPERVAVIEVGLESNGDVLANRFWHSLIVLVISGGEEYHYHCGKESLWRVRVAICAFITGLSH